MSFVARRSLSTLIPPKIASAKNLGSNPSAKRMEQVVSFYKKLPQGEAQFPKLTGLIGKYRSKYFDGENASGVPVLHLAFGILLLGYSTQYYFHLRHHKEH